MLLDGTPKNLRRFLCRFDAGGLIRNLMFVRIDRQSLRPAAMPCRTVVAGFPWTFSQEDSGRDRPVR